jgi:deazaflavin-dependent oxidoreductase (nitroreductase family)
MATWDWFGRAHRAVYERTGGRIGARMAGIDMLLLTTIGRRSGRARTLPLACLPDGNDLVVVASNSGQAKDPAWWLNLRENPEAEVRLGRERFRVRAALATPEERERLWPRLKRHNRSYARYERMTSREIPVVVLRRVGA